jgi:hypothetical protein
MFPLLGVVNVLGIILFLVQILVFLLLLREVLLEFLEKLACRSGDAVLFSSDSTRDGVRFIP